MGDRVSIQFTNGDQSSVVLFSHWGGENFAKRAIHFARGLILESEGKPSVPLYRLEPRTVMVEFIHQLTKDWKGRVESDLYLGATDHDGDNSDNGHYTIIFDEDKRGVIVYRTKVTAEVVNL